MSDPFAPRPKPENRDAVASDERRSNAGTWKVIFGAVVALVVLACGAIIVASMSDDGAARPADASQSDPVPTAAPTRRASGSSGGQPAVTTSKMRTPRGDTFRQSIGRNIANQDAASLRIACDAAKSNLGDSSNVNELKDWGDLIPACNAGLAGDWTSARIALP